MGETLIRHGESIVEAARRNGIDAVYAARNEGGTMHDAGERAAVTALRVVREALADARRIVADMEEKSEIPDGEFPGHKGIYLANLEGVLGQRMAALLTALEAVEEECHKASA